MKSAFDTLKNLDINLDCLDDFEIVFENRRVDLPLVYLYPNQKPPVIKAIANKPALIRYALADLLLHEVAEQHFYTEHQTYDGDSHYNPEFQYLELAIKRRILEAIEKLD